METIEYVNLGSTGTNVSRLCPDGWRFGKENAGVVEVLLSEDQRERITSASDG